ncbi:hypothetical protein GOB94_07240 [Granulicella sp. 5B5]|uniref:FUSC family protein n=1 Tax=Granulicella sp. 5B5 TaxID=1617967 RepID=UPI0015F63432|nr:FUSC family protein [Granulicella sp. 5B5]QMV18502.1 hypothetical protein GOB94_07240 [Granulicella sp. 5B5]
MPATFSRKSLFASLLGGELAPYPGRLAGSLRDTLAICIALVISMALQVPGLALSLALLFLLQRERPGLTLKISLQVFSAAALSLAASLLWVQITDGTETARFLGVVLGIFVSAFCMAGTTEPLFFTIFGFYGFVFLSAWDAHRSASAIVATSLFDLASLGLVILCANAVEYTFGTRHPADELRWEMLQRLQLLSKFFRALSQGSADISPGELRLLQNALMQYGNASDVRMNELYDRLRNTREGLARVPIGTHYRIGLLTRAIQKSILIGFGFLHGSQREDRASYRILAELCDHLSSSESGAFHDRLPAGAASNLQGVFLELRQYAESRDTVAVSRQQTAKVYGGTLRSLQIFLPNTFQSPDAAVYALKLTLAATSCYVLFNAFAWPGIVTCVVTVLFTGLSSTGAMKQKQLYRFSGAAVGGFLGIATVSLLYPNMDSITSLTLVVAAVSMLSAWVMRSPRISYVGLQIAFGFFLTALPGFKPAMHLEPARDRIAGIALGILVMWFIFDQLWPMRTAAALESILHRVRKTCEQVKRAAQKDVAGSGSELIHLRNVVSLDLVSVQQLDSAVYFDIGRHQKRELACSRRLIRQIEVAAAEFYADALQLTHDEADAEDIPG